MANILELDPFAFDAALQELGLSDEDQARLRDQYRKKNSTFAGVKEALASEEGRNTSEFLPVSVPEGQSISEGLMSGEWDWAMPEAFSQGISTALEGVEAPGQILSGVPFSEQEMQQAMWKTAGTAGAGSLTFDAPEGATRMFGGMRAKKYPWDRDAQLAERIDQAFSQGKDIDPDIAWEDFGIEFGEQGPMFQIDPAGAKTRTPASVEKSLDTYLQNHGDASFDMEEVLDFPELFENYPVLKNFKVTVKSERSPGEPLKKGGWFDAKGREIVVGEETAKNPEDFRSVLLHELQHGIQAVESTSGGAASSYFLRHNPDTGLFETGAKDLQPDVDKLNTLYDQVVDAEINYGESSETYQNLYQQYREQYNNLGDRAWKKYLTNSGEVEARAAQLWDQLSSEEKRTTKPSDIKREALGLLKREYGDNEMPTGRLSNTYAEGGMVKGNNMDNDMTMLSAEGGLNTGDTQVDPVSGNEVPPGSMPEEVRDDVDSKLSGGEYVVPADVLRFYGVSFFEKLRKKAKEGLAEMEAEGRIGGDSGEEAPEVEEEEEDDDLPFGDDELMFEDDGEEMEFNAGGVVPPGGIKTFDPTQFYAGFSAFGTPTGTAPTAPTAPVPETPAAPVAATPTPAPESWADKQLGRTTPTAGNSRTRQNTEASIPDWATGKDWSKMSEVDAVSLAADRLSGSKGTKALGAAGALLGPIGGAIGMGYSSLRPFAEANAIERVLRAQGNTKAADAVAKMTDKELKDSGWGTRTLEPLLAGGTKLAQRIMGAPAATQGTSARANAVSAKSRATPSNSGTPAKAVGTVTARTQESWADKQSPAKKDTPKDTTSKSGSVSFGAANKGSTSRSSGSKSTRKAEGGLIERRKK